jgi:GMP synthase (glutamine-hydrolysing)
VGCIEAMDRDPGRRDLAWRLGLDAEVIEPELRTRELRNFLAHIGRRG